MDQTTVNILVEAIREATEPHWTTYLSAWATLGLFVVALAALGYAAYHVETAKDANTLSIKHLEEIANANQDQYRIARAHFLFSLDAMFEGDRIGEARKEYNVLKAEISTAVSNDEACKHLTPDGITTEFRSRFSRRLYELKEKEHGRYLSMINLCGFFETAGLLVESEMINMDHIFGLYGGAIVEVYDDFEDHLNKRRNDEESGDEYFKYFRLLAAQARNRM